LGTKKGRKEGRKVRSVRKKGRTVRIERVSSSRNRRAFQGAAAAGAEEGRTEGACSASAGDQVSGWRKVPAAAVAAAAELVQVLAAEVDR